MILYVLPFSTILYSVILYVKDPDIINLSQPRIIAKEKVIHVIPHFSCPASVEPDPSIFS